MQLFVRMDSVGTTAQLSQRLEPIAIMKLKLIIRLAQWAYKAVTLLSFITKPGMLKGFLDGKSGKWYMECKACRFEYRST